MYFHSIKIKKTMAIGIIFLATSLMSTTTLSTPLSASLSEAEREVVLSEAELAQALAPIALYPDTLLTHMLIAATYPIEVVEADRWLKTNSQFSAEQLAHKSQQKNWDMSIKALLSFPQVIEKLSENLTWMQKLGDAFLQDEARVLASIQTLRQQAEQAGSLANIDNVSVIKEQNIIIIEPAQPEIIYVPYYDTRVVYGQWYWSHYPPVYWHNPHYGHFYWGYGINIRSPFYFSTFNWHKRYVIVNPGNYYHRRGYHSRKKIVTSHQAKRWHHQPQHRRGVAYSHGRLKKKYYGARSSVRKTNTYQQRTNKSYAQNNKVFQATKGLKSTNVKSINSQSKKQKKYYRNSTAVKKSQNSTQQKTQQNRVNRQVKQQAKYKNNISSSKAEINKNNTRPQKQRKQNTRRSTKLSANRSKQQHSKQQIK